MKHPLRNVVVAALTAAVALGAGAPAASAAGRHQLDAHGHAQHAPHDHGRADRAGKHAAAQQRQVVRDIARLDARLASVSRDRGLGGVTDEQQADVLANVAADRAALRALAESVLAPGSSVDLGSVRASLRDLRPEVYTVALLDLRRAARLQATVQQNTVDLAAVTDRDVTAGVDANGQAAAALADAVARALAVTATSSKADLRAINADFRTADQALDAVEQVLAGNDDSTESTDTTDPTDPADA